MHCPSFVLGYKKNVRRREKQMGIFPFLMPFEENDWVDEGL